MLPSLQSLLAKLAMRIRRCANDYQIDIRIREEVLCSPVMLRFWVVDSAMLSRLNI